MQSLVLLALAFGLSFAIQCPSGFNDDGSGSCFNGVNQYPTTYANGRSSCLARNSSFLYDIKNAFENSKVQGLGRGLESLWLGLTCLTNSTTSCMWDDGRVLTSRDYTNFYGGNPNADAGACVMMLVSNGKWLSVSCNAQTGYGCQFTPGTTVKSCADSRAFYLQGKCYYPTYYVSSVDIAQQSCQQTCGNLASIHSAGENSFVRDIITYNPPTYTFLGLKSNRGSFYWLDGTPYDYFGFGYQNPSLGSCASMALQDDVVPKGKWINSQCSVSNPISAVCKKETITDCDRAPVTTMPPTLSPTECTGPIYETGSGDLYSPGYPRPSDPNNCEYLITEDEGNQASITFQDVSLDWNSHIYLYSSFMDKTPFATLTNTNYNTRTYYSSTNVLKIVFNTTGASNNYFHGVYNGGFEQTTTVALDVCGQWLYDWDGNSVHSPNYPGSYPITNRNCSNYLISYTYGGVCVVFDVLGIRNGDYIDLIDYYTGLRFQRLHYATPDQIFCSPTEAPLIILDFVTSYVNNYPSNVIGYHARFGGRYDLGFTDAPDATVTMVTTTLGTQGTSESIPSTDMNCNGGDFYNDGYFSSPNYDNEYPPYMNCEYTLHSDKNAILLEFKDFYTEYNYDQVSVYDEGNGLLLATYSGQISGKQVQSYTRTMRVVFKTDASVQYRGFLAKFTSIY